MWAIHLSILSQYVCGTISLNILKQTSSRVHLPLQKTMMLFGWDALANCHWQREITGTEGSWGLHEESVMSPKKEWTAPAPRELLYKEAISEQSSLLENGSSFAQIAQAQRACCQLPAVPGKDDYSYLLNHSSLLTLHSPRGAMSNVSEMRKENHREENPSNPLTSQVESFLLTKTPYLKTWTLNGGWTQRLLRGTHPSKYKIETGLKVTVGFFNNSDWPEICNGLSFPPRARGNKQSWRGTGKTSEIVPCFFNILITITNNHCYHHSPKWKRREFMAVPLAGWTLTSADHRNWSRKCTVFSEGSGSKGQWLSSLIIVWRDSRETQIITGHSRPTVTWLHLST